MQDELITSIAIQLGSELARAEFKLNRLQIPSDMNAWPLYQSAKGKLMFMGWNKKPISEAAAELRQAITLDLQFFPALVLRAWIQSTKGELESAQILYNEAKKLYPPLDESYIIGLMGKELLVQMQNSGLKFANA